MELADKGAEWADAFFEMGNEAGVKVQEPDEGVEGLTGGWEGPVADEIELG